MKKLKREPVHSFAFQQGINRKSEKLPLTIKEKEDVAWGVSLISRALM